MDGVPEELSRLLIIDVRLSERKDNGGQSNTLRSSIEPRTRDQVNCDDGDLDLASSVPLMNSRQKVFHQTRSFSKMDAAMRAKQAVTNDNAIVLARHHLMSYFPSVK